jgi:hypothetical protein
MYVPVWTLFFFIPGVLSAIMPWVIGLSILFAGVVVVMEIPNWCLALLTRAAQALPACWLFDGPAQPSKAVETKPVEPFTAKDVDWDWRHDDTDYPVGRR